MQIKSKYLQWVIVLLIPFLLASFSYLFDLIMTPDLAIHQPYYWTNYLVFYILVRLIFFMPVIWVYPLIFKKNNKRNKLLGLGYAIFFGLFFAIGIFDHDVGMVLTLSKTKIAITYPLTAAIIYYVYEFLGENRKNLYKEQ